MAEENNFVEIWENGRLIYASHPDLNNSKESEDDLVTTQEVETMEVQSTRTESNYDVVAKNSPITKNCDVAMDDLEQIHDPIEEDVGEMFPAIGPYQCEICQNITLTKVEFVDHLKIEHAGVVDKNVLC